MSKLEEEKAPGQFNFINSRLRMNENYAENQNEYEKMSLMVENLVKCKINQVFKDIEHVNEDLKTQISYAINAHEEKTKENVNNPYLSTSDDKSNQEAVKRLTEENKKLTEEAAKLTQEAANKKLTEEAANKSVNDNPTNKSKNDIDAFYIATKKLKEV